MHIKSKDFSCPLIWHYQILLQQKTGSTSDEASIQRCMVLEDKEEDPENEQVVEKEELEDKLDTV